VQGARRAHIHWPIFNRRATPQSGMHRFPNADVFVGQDTSLHFSPVFVAKRSPTRQSRYGGGARRGLGLQGLRPFDPVHPEEYRRADSGTPFGKAQGRQYDPTSSEDGSFGIWSFRDSDLFRISCFGFRAWLPSRSYQPMQ
jgi:hypothetical protein